MKALCNNCSDQAVLSKCPECGELYCGSCYDFAADMCKGCRDDKDEHEDTEKPELSPVGKAIRTLGDALKYVMDKYEGLEKYIKETKTFTAADWHSPEEEPDGRTVLAIYNKGNTPDLYYSYEYAGAWKLIVKRQNIKAWAYISDLPKPEGAE